MADFPTTIFIPRDTENLPGLARADAVDKALKQNLFSEDYQDLGGEISAVETILGTTPQGSYSTVKAYLTALAVALSGKEDALGFTPENVGNKKTSLVDDSDTYYPSQKAVKTAVDGKQDVAIVASKSTTFTFNDSGTSNSVDLKMQKIGNWVTIFIPTFLATTSTNSYFLLSNTAIDAAYRPAIEQKFLCATIKQNGNEFAFPGYLLMRTDGKIQLGKNNGDALTSSVPNTGLNESISISYYVG